MTELEENSWPIEDPNIAVITCMKDEGPFILEWISWHLAVGVTKFLVYTNDCTDGTDHILNHLEDLGIVKHIPNPALSSVENVALQPTALRHSHYTREFIEADFVISMDVDEFINVRIGDGSLHSLFNKVGQFDALSMTEVNHGSNGNFFYEDAWLKDRFPKHQTLTPGPKKAKRGVKTIIRKSDRLERMRNHRSDFKSEFDDVRWLNGSGAEMDDFLNDPDLNGLDCRKTYDLVLLNHFPLRSLDSFLAKGLRGDVVVKGKSVSNRYWRTRNYQEDERAGFAKMNDSARQIYKTIFETDKKLMDLHNLACKKHIELVAESHKHPELMERKKWILDEAWRNENNKLRQMTVDEVEALRHDK